MNLRDRLRKIRGIEEKFFAPVATDGKKLPVPILISSYVKARPDGTGLEEPIRAKVDGQTYHREPGESLEQFEKRMIALLRPLEPEHFAHEIVYSVSELP